MYILILYTIGSSTPEGKSFVCDEFTFSVRFGCFIGSIYMGSLYTAVLATVWYFFWTITFLFTSLCVKNNSCKKKLIVYNISNNDDLAIFRNEQGEKAFRKIKSKLNSNV